MKPIHDTLIVAPYVGEFGWELMNWQGRVRRIAAQRRYKRIVVCARPDRRPLYGGFRAEGPVLFCPVTKLDLPGVPNEDHRVDESGRVIDAGLIRSVVERVCADALQALRLPVGDSDLLTPDFHGALWPTTSEAQQFHELRIAAPVETDILLVPRMRDVATDRNLPPQWWDELEDRLKRRHLRVERYGATLTEAIRRLSRTRLAIGASTGGLHLASLCRCPHYVWGSGKEIRWTQWSITNRQRYETFWNPFGTPCIYDETGWQPAAESVADRACRALDEIGLLPGQSTAGWSLKPRWRMKRTLANWLAHSPHGWPWTVQRVVREYLV